MLDVGAHLGETLREVTRPQWRFDRIYCFEPASACWPMLDACIDSRVEICHFGLWSASTRMMLHDPGLIGASVKPQKAISAQVEECAFVDVASWFAAHLKNDDVVFAKFNCEGAECEILARLLDTGEIRKVRHLVVHFDLRKIQALAMHADDMERRLQCAHVPYIDARAIMHGRSLALKTANWLRWCEGSALCRFRCRYLNKVAFRARQIAYPLKVSVAGRLRAVRRKRAAQVTGSS
jgi:FkbM family methyltransferase